MVYAVTPRSRAELRAAAMLLRRKFGFSDDAPVDPLRILEMLDKFGADFEIVPEWELGEKHGETILEQGVIKIREDVYKGAVNGKGRDRFTICHEIAHLFLHGKLSHGVSLSRMGSEYVPVYMDPEWQANAFAAEFMMPYNKLRSGMTALDVMQTYGVSKAAAQNQLRHCW